MQTWENIRKSGRHQVPGIPPNDDIGYYLRATAMYTDKFGSGKTASVMSENVVEARTTSNAQPSFDDLDDDNNGDTHD